MITHIMDMDKEITEPIFFYEPEFYVFSNFSAFALEWKGKLWMTSEHAYQAEKFEKDYLKEKILQARSAHDALKIAEAHKDEYRSGWDDMKLGIMKEILKAKLAQHPYVMKKFMESGKRELIENSWRDSYWGWGPHKDGANHLGKLWMEIRAEIIPKPKT